MHDNSDDDNDGDAMMMTMTIMAKCLIELYGYSENVHVKSPLVTAALYCADVYLTCILFAMNLSTAGAVVSPVVNTTAYWPENDHDDADDGNDGDDDYATFPV